LAKQLLYQQSFIKEKKERKKKKKKPTKPNQTFKLENAKCVLYRRSRFFHQLGSGSHAD
jgi:hypothetical protein